MALSASRIISAAVATVATLALAVSLLALGFAAACLPVTTEAVSRSVSDAALSPYAKDDLVALACRTRSFTVDGHQSPEAGAAAEEALFSAIADAAVNSSEDPEKGGRWNGRALEALDTYTAGAADAAATVEALASIDTAYALDADAVSHLEDCNVLIARAAPILWALAVLAVALLILAQRLDSRRARRGHLTARILVAAPAMLGIVLVGCMLWAIVDFRGFFAMFHTVFFPQGNWTFAYDSLLICMYPTAFWTAMGAVWLLTSIAASILCAALGIGLTIKARNTKE